MFSWVILEKSRLSIKDIEGAEKVINLNFTKTEKDSMISGLQQLTKSYEQIRNYFSCRRLTKRKSRLVSAPTGQMSMMFIW